MINQRISRHQSGAVNARVIALVVAVAVIAIGIWMFSSREPEPEPVAPQAVEPQPQRPSPVPEAVQRAPDIPRERPAPVVEEPEEPAEVLPPLPESDEFARETLAPLSDEAEYDLWLQTDNLLQKTTSIIDGFSKGNVLYKIIPVQPPVEKFKVRRQDDRIYLNEANYERYDGVITTLVNVPPRAFAAAFHTLRPLLEEAYGDLGNPPDKVDNSLIAAIDLALATPDVSDPVALKSESVYYQFADPELESLPMLQKQLIRVGPENRQRIKDYLTQVRAALLASGDEQ